MISVLVSLLLTARSGLRSRAALQLEVLALRHQLQVLHRSRPRHVRLAHVDRLCWVCLSRVWSDWRAALVIVQPETVIAWHRRGFRAFWAWKSRRRAGRLSAPADVQALIRTMADGNPQWGAPRIHGELLKLGIKISQTTVAKYLVRRRPSPSQSWRTFLTNHVSQIVAADFFVVPTATCRLLFVLVILSHERRRVVHIGVTDHPTAAWTAQQLREAFPWDDAPRYLLRDRDHAFDGWAYTSKALGIEEILTAPRSPWQNAYVERFHRVRPTRMPRSRSSCSARRGSSVCSVSTAITTTAPAHISRSTRTRRFRAASRRPVTAGSWRFRKSAASIIGTNGAPPDRSKRAFQILSHARGRKPAGRRVLAMPNPEPGRSAELNRHARRGGYGQPIDSARRDFRQGPGRWQGRQLPSRVGCPHAAFRFAATPAACATSSVLVIAHQACEPSTQEHLRM